MSTERDSVQFRENREKRLVEGKEVTDLSANIIIICI